MFLSHIDFNLARSPRGFWKVNDNHQRFFNWLYIELGYKSMDDWYQVTKDVIAKNGGHGLLDCYNDSISKALQTSYPEHDWMIRRFKLVPHGYWQSLLTDTRETKRMIDWLGRQLSIQCLDDWYRVSLEQIRRWIQIESSKDLDLMLKSSYPEHQWDDNLLNKIGRVIKSSQMELMIATQRIFPNHGEDKRNTLTMQRWRKSTSILRCYISVGFPSNWTCSSKT
jgi:hypothetical protein